MATQKGIIEIAGSLGGFVAYTLNGKKVVRSKHSIDKKRIAEDPAFEGTRRHNTEFGHMNIVGKYFRKALSPFTGPIAHNYLHNTVAKALWTVLELDPSETGKRTVYGGLRQAGGGEILKGLEFNDALRVGGMLSFKLMTDLENGTVTLPDFSGVYDAKAPKRATHICFSACMALLDLEGEEYELNISEEIEVPIDEEERDIVLDCGPVEGEGLRLLILKVVVVEKEWDRRWMLMGGGRVVGTEADFVP